jgi:hypothetical protein
MMSTWLLAVVLAEASGAEGNRVNQADQAIVVPLSGATMTCTKEGDHLVCVVPLEKEAAKEARSAPTVAPKARVYKPSQPALTLPGPEAFAQLKVAEANIKLAKSLLPQATTPEEVVLSQQLLYRAKEQYRTARALLHTVQGDLDRAPDPFDRDNHESDSNAMALCQSEPDVDEECNTAAP